MGKGDLVNFTLLGKGMASGRAADDKKEPKHEHDKS